MGGTLGGLAGPVTLFFITYFKSSPKDIFIDFRERDIDVREIYQLVASSTRPDQGSNPQPKAGTATLIHSGTRG